LRDQPAKRPERLQQFYLNVIQPERHVFQKLFDNKIRMASATCSTRAGFNEWHSFGIAGRRDLALTGIGRNANKAVLLGT